VDEPGDGALAGIRVLELATLYSAPLIGAMLGDLGADVVKIETPTGDPMRQMGEMRGGRSLGWAHVGRNKRSVVLDLEGTGDRATMERLVARADVLITNQPRDVLTRWGCAWHQVSVHNPRLVAVEMSAYGSDGPLGGLPGNGSMSEAFGGVASMIGEFDGPPMLASVPLGDTLAAWQGAFGTVVALYARDASGGTGQRIDLAMYEPVLALLATASLGWRPDRPAPRRNGSRVDGAVPRNVYRTADDHYVVISGPTDQQVVRILELLGRAGPTDLARFGNAPSRVVHGDELDGLVADWVRAHTATEVTGAMDALRIPHSPVNDLGDIAAHPQVRHRHSLVDVHDPTAGPFTMPAPLPPLGATPSRVRSAAPALGADRDAVLAEWLGPGSA
jgi:crotonobetainyl-CoA:carnitine CoA-transferase CaiB-like acyl-CoA transferase